VSIEPSRHLRLFNDYQTIFLSLSLWKVWDIRSCGSSSSIRLPILSYWAQLIIFNVLPSTLSIITTLLQELIIIKVFNMVLTVPNHHVLHNIILTVENDVSQLTEVLNHPLGLKLSLDCNLLRNTRVLVLDSEVTVLNELFYQWVQDTVVLSILWEPGPTTETQSWIWVFQKVNHVVKRHVLLAFYLFLKWFILWVNVGCELPEGSELLNRALLLGSVGFVLQIFNNDIWKDFRNQEVKLTNQLHNLLCFDFLIQYLPKILDDLLAMRMAVLLSYSLT